jgi:SAM-dependent methyltransferase
MGSHVRLFHLIAGIYAWFFHSEQRMFRSVVAAQAGKAGAGPGDSFLDVGCGTGALISVLEEAGFRAQGVDAAPNMVRAARRAGCGCELADIAAGLPYPDASFDFVTASFVAHGLPPGLRMRLYEEARRIARKAVIIHDYHGKQSLLTEMVERLEGGDFFGFVSSGEAQMRAAFADIDVVDIGNRKAWYIGRQPGEARRGAT